MTAEEPPRGRKLLRGLVIAAFVAALAYLLIGEHRVHVLGWLPFLLLLLCPLMHVFMHGGHGASQEQGAGHQHR